MTKQGISAFITKWGDDKASVIKKESKTVNHEWVKKKKCSLAYNINI